MKRLTDAERAKDLGMSLDEFQKLAGFDVLDQHPEFLKAGECHDIIKKPFPTDDDVRHKNADELEHHWNRPVTSDEDKALYYGYHIHSKDNVFGLHAHYPGGPLGGGHVHGAQNKLGYHTHRYNIAELKALKFGRPGTMVELDGPHSHLMNAPDGKHVHSEENFGPAE